MKTVCILAVERISKTKDIDLEGHMVHIEIMQNVTVETCTVEVVSKTEIAELRYILPIHLK